MLKLTASIVSVNCFFFLEILIDSGGMHYANKKLIENKTESFIANVSADLQSLRANGITRS